MTTEAMAQVAEESGMDDLATIKEKKKLALSYISEAWDEALAEGIDSEIVAHAALFTALCDLIATYGEEPVAELAKTLPQRIRDLEFTVTEQSLQ
jgi:hypothetical protein